MKPFPIVLSDENAAHCGTPQILPLLRRAVALARPRKQSRTRISKILGGQPHWETWRDSLYRYLRRRLPAWCIIYRGGHHLAIHQRNPVGGMSEVCFARLCENQSRRKVEPETKTQPSS